MTLQPLTKPGYPAGLARRLGAMLYDGLLLIALWMVTLTIFVVATNDAVSGWPVQVVLAVEAIALPGFTMSRQGHTLGMLSWRLTLVDDQGAIPPWPKVLTRLLIAPLSLIVLGLGYLWIYVGKEQRTWHGRISGTRIVHTPD